MTDPLAERLADAVVDRRRIKRRLVWWRALAVIAVAVIAGWAGWSLTGQPALTDSGGYVARLPIEGMIQDQPELARHINQLANSPNVLGVLVAINSPGGTFSGSEALFTALRDLAEAKPTTAVIGGMAASGGYMAAIATDHIVARAGSITGSVGVIFQMPQVHRLLDDLGIDMETVRSGPLKASPDPLHPTSDAARAASKALIDDLFQQFLGMVTSRRDLSTEALREVTRGGVFTGRRGLELGLIDAIGGEEEARNWLATEHNIDPEAPVIQRPLQQPGEWWERLADRIENQTRLGATPVLDGPWAVWHY